MKKQTIAPAGQAGFSTLEMWLNRENEKFSSNSLCISKINHHLCNALHFEKGEKARQITLLRAFFMSEALPIIHIGSVPCGALMRPLPFSRCSATGSGTFSVSSPEFLTF